MNAGAYLYLMWQQADIWQLISAIILGCIVGVIYFQSLRWSLNRLSMTKHKIKLFAGVALLRILLFFGVLILIAQHNALIVLIYVLVFFITKMIIIIREKGKMVKFETGNKQNGHS